MVYEVFRLSAAEVWVFRFSVCPHGAWVFSGFNVCPFTVVWVLRFYRLPAAVWVL